MRCCKAPSLSPWHERQEEEDFASLPAIPGWCKMSHMSLSPTWLMCPSIDQTIMNSKIRVQVTRQVSASDLWNLETSWLLNWSFLCLILCHGDFLAIKHTSIAWPDSTLLQRVCLCSCTGMQLLAWDRGGRCNHLEGFDGRECFSWVSHQPPKWIRGWPHRWFSEALAARGAEMGAAQKVSWCWGISCRRLASQLPDGRRIAMVDINQLSENIPWPFICDWTFAT